MKTRPKRLLSSILATMLLGQSLLCNNAIFTAFTAKAETPTHMTSNLDVSDLNISGYIDLEDGRTKEISVIVFDDNWNTIAETKVLSGEYFSVSAAGVRNYSSTTHVKIECNGYLPRFYKDMGFGSYQLGTSEKPETLYFGDTTYNPGANNQWSDEAINYDDLTFVSEQVGKIKGDENYDAFYDFNHDNAINNNDIAIIAKYDGAIYENGRLYTSATKEYYYIYPENILIYDLNQDNRIDSNDQQVICDLYPYESLKGDEDFDQFAYMDIDDDGAITDDDYNYFQTYINLHDGCNPYNDYIYNLILTGDSYHNSAMYLENTNLDLANYKLVVNGNFVFRTQNPYHSMWNSNPGVTLNVNAGTLFIADQFDFGQANSYDKIVMTNDNGKLYVNGIWNYITLADMEGLWTKGTIYFFGSTWQVNEASGDKSIYSTGTHSICFYYQYGQQIIRWANTQDCIYNEETGEYNTHRRFNFDYKDNNGNCLGLTFPCGYSDDRYYFRASLPEEVTNQNTATTIPYEDWELLNDNNANTIPDIIDTQIENENYAAISNEWLEDNYGDTIDEFVVNEASFSIDDLNNNKKYFIDFLYYLKNTYDKDSEEYEKAIQVLTYLRDSLYQIVAGDYTDKTTILGTIGQITISVIPSPYSWAIDLVFDIRDLSENIVAAVIYPESMGTLEWEIDLFFDILSIIPEVGTALKELKNVDKVTNVKGIKKYIYEKLLKQIPEDSKDFLKGLDEIKDAKKYTKVLKDAEKLKSIQKVFNELIEDKGSEVLDFYFEYGIDALEILAEYSEYYDDIKAILERMPSDYYTELKNILKNFKGTDDINVVINFLKEVDISEVKTALDILNYFSENKEIVKEIIALPELLKILYTAEETDFWNFIEFIENYEKTGIQLLKEYGKDIITVTTDLKDQSEFFIASSENLNEIINLYREKRETYNNIIAYIDQISSILKEKLNTSDKNVTISDIEKTFELYYDDSIKSLKEKDKFKNYVAKATVTEADLKKWTDSYDFLRDSTLEHIFKGTPAHKGFHYVNNLSDATASHIISDKNYLGDKGVYEATAEVYGSTKIGNDGVSTFFPDSWSPQDVINAINEAYHSKPEKPLHGNEYRSIGNGINITMYLDSSGKIISVFPSDEQ